MNKWMNEWMTDGQWTRTNKNMIKIKTVSKKQPNNNNDW